MSGIQDIPQRVPDQWNPKWFEVFIRDVLAKADIRNAEGVGLSITGNSDEIATITGASGDGSFVVITANPDLALERVLAIESGVLTLTDNGAGLTVEIGVAAAGITIVKGGTGSGTAAGARTNLGLVIGTDVQAFSSALATYVANALTAVELQQLQNIDTETISNAQWAFLGALNQALTTTSAVVFLTTDVGTGGYLVSGTKVVGAQQAAIASLTNSTGGSADGTMSAVGDTSTIDQSGVINDNFTELFAKQDAILAALRTHGLIDT